MSGRVNPTEYASRRARAATPGTRGCSRRRRSGPGSCARPAGRGVGPGSCRSACRSTLMWSAAVLEPALPAAQQHPDRLAGAVLPVVDERDTADGCPYPRLECRRGLLLVAVRGDQHSVHVDDQRPRRVASWSGACRRPAARPGPGPPPAPASIAASTRGVRRPRPGRRSVRETVGSDATGPNTAGSARSTATSARQSPPSATATARSSSTLAGSCTAAGLRHGASACDSASSSPAAADRLHQQHPAGLRHRRRPARVDPHPRIQPSTLHPESAPRLARSGPSSKPHRSRSGALSRSRHAEDHARFRLVVRSCECCEQTGSGLDAVASVDVPAGANVSRTGRFRAAHRCRTRRRRCRSVRGTPPRSGRRRTHPSEAQLTAAPLRANSIQWYSTCPPVKVFEPEEDCRQVGMRRQEGPFGLRVVGLRPVESVEFV